MTLDTARADHFGAFSADSPVATPVMDRLAAEGTRFTTAISPAPVTLVSHTSLWTGQVPPTHGVRDNGTFRLSDDRATLATVAREGGWTTGAFVAAPVLHARFGLARGFQVYDDQVGKGDVPYRRGEDVVGSALEWIRSAPGHPSLTWVHLYDSHTPYAAPAPEGSHYADPYQAEIAYTDRVLGTLLDGWRAALGPDARPLVVVTADHGEGLGDHGEYTHGVFIYDEIVRVPLVMQGHGIPEGATVDAQVRLIDLAPTLATRMGLSLPAAEGADLTGLMSGGDTTERPAYIESLYPRLHFGWSQLRGVRTSSHKLIRGASDELYDLEADPRERTDQAHQNADTVAALAARLPVEADVEAVVEANAEAARGMDEATRTQLEALGYLWTAEGGASGGGLADPRDKIALLERLNSANELLEKSQVDAAVAALESVLADDPGNASAHRLMAEAVERRQDFAGAARHFGEAARLSPGDSGAWERAATAWLRVQDPEAAEQALLRARQAAPDDVELRARRWMLLRRMGRSAVVRAEAAEAMAAGDTSARGAWIGLSLERESSPDDEAEGDEAELDKVLYDLVNADKVEPDRAARQIALQGLFARAERRARAGDAAGAARDLERTSGALAAGANPEALAAPANGVADLLWAAGAWPQAALAYEIVAQHLPDDPRPLYNAGICRLRSGQPDRARAHFEAVLARDPGFPKAAEHLAELPR